MCSVRCRKLRDTPFPFVLAQAVSGLVLLLTLAVPFHMAASFGSGAAAALFAALVTLVRLPGD